MAQMPKDKKKDTPTVKKLDKKMGEFAAEPYEDGKMKLTPAMLKAIKDSPKGQLPASIAKRVAKKGKKATK